MKLAQECGIYNRLQPVLSLLGTSDVSVSEMAKLYQTFVVKSIQIFQDGPKNKSPLFEG